MLHSSTRRRCTWPGSPFWTEKNSSYLDSSTRDSVSLPTLTIVESLQVFREQLLQHWVRRCRLLSTATSCSFPSIRVVLSMSSDRFWTQIVYLNSTPKFRQILNAISSLKWCTLPSIPATQLLHLYQRRFDTHALCSGMVYDSILLGSSSFFPSQW